MLKIFVRLFCGALLLHGCMGAGELSRKPDPASYSYVDADGSTLVCLPGCELKTDEGNAPIVPDWCIGYEAVGGGPGYRCTKIDLKKVPTSSAPYEPEVVHGNPEYGDEIEQLACLPGCRLPKKEFGCEKPAGKARHLQWCSTVVNACHTGQAPVYIGWPVDPGPGVEPDPFCAALSVTPTPEDKLRKQE